VMSLGSSVSGLDMVIDRVRDLANNRGDKQRRNRRERASMRSSFRELRSVMEVGGWLRNAAYGTFASALAGSLRLGVVASSAAVADTCAECIEGKAANAVMACVAVYVGQD
jgi:hypothetical protein